MAMIEIRSYSCLHVFSDAWVVDGADAYWETTISMDANVTAKVSDVEFVPCSSEVGRPGHCIWQRRWCPTGNPVLAVSIHVAHHHKKRWISAGGSCHEGCPHVGPRLLRTVLVFDPTSALPTWSRQAWGHNEPPCCYRWPG